MESPHQRKPSSGQSGKVLGATELGTKFPYPALIRKDLREGKYEESTECDQAKDVPATELWGRPLGASCPCAW